MKNRILLLAGCTAFAMTASVKAQITVNSLQVEIGKPLSVNNIKAIGTLSLDLGKCGVTFSNWMSNSGSIIVRPSSTTDEDQPAAVVNPSFYDRAAITPSMNRFMDLGSATNRFQTLYTVNVDNINAPTQMSDVRYKENIQNLQGATATLLKLRPVSFDFKADNDLFDTADLKGKVGFIAQEVLNVLPNQVKYLSETDIYTLDYVSMIPYLVRAFQETYTENENLRSEVEELREVVEWMKEQLAAPQNTTVNKAPKAGKTEKEAGADQTALMQNMPNPFSESTVIEYTLPAKAKSATLHIYSNTESLVRSYSLPTGDRKGSITVESYSLTPSVYTYSLITDGKIFDSKRMVITE
ncbi:MAG: tail fiber domain-containing protein [Lachnospiraceae bacterium]|nr:tail fiber domain-containing protein [Lachnospiraceae bacterium]